jgi:hypothetical protein
MRTALATFFTIALCCCVVLAQEPPTGQGGFRELLGIIEIEPASLESISAEQLTAADWNVLAQILHRLGQQSDVDLKRWTLSRERLQSESVGELIELTGTAERVDALMAPDGAIPDAEITKLFRTTVKLSDGTSAEVLSTAIPTRWDLKSSLNEPIAVRGVLLRGGEKPLLLARNISWHPTTGVPSGQLLLSRFGMDASLWDSVVQRSRLISPEKGREAEAFYEVLASMSNVPAAELKKATDQAIADAVSDSAAPTTKLERQIATATEELAARGLSSVVPLFLDPANSAGNLVRVEGIARRAVRVADSDPTREYYELEVFTPDSQNLPLVFAVKSLPPDFPVGDAIHAGVRIEGVFFKSWQYRTRKVVDGNGATDTQQQRYTPLLMAATLTWLQETPAAPSWWGLAVGSAIFVAITAGLVRLIVSYKRDRLGRTSDTPPDFSGLN